jgi:hypothetical protein
VVVGQCRVCVRYSFLHYAKRCSLAKAKRWTTGPAFDGSFGVDAQDILSIPEINLGSFQLFPDQNNYAPTNTPFTPPSSAFDVTLEVGIQWIEAQIGLALQWVFPPFQLLSLRLTPVLRCVELASQWYSLRLVLSLKATSGISSPSMAHHPLQNLQCRIGSASRFATQCFTIICLKEVFSVGQAGTLGTGVTDTQRNSAYLGWLEGLYCAGVATNAYRSRLLTPMSLQLGLPVVSVEWVNTRSVAGYRSFTTTIDPYLFISYSGLRRAWRPGLAHSCRVRAEEEQWVSPPTMVTELLGVLLRCTAIIDHWTNVVAALVRLVYSKLCRTRSRTSHKFARLPTLDDPDIMIPCHLLTLHGCGCMCTRMFWTTPFLGYP